MSFLTATDGDTGGGGDPDPPESVPDTANLQSYYAADEIDAIGGQTVNMWPDGAGSFDATDDGSPPVYRTGEINGLPAVDFAGDAYLDTGYRHDTDGPWSLYAVARVDNTGGTNHVYGAQSGDNRAYTGIDAGEWRAGYGDTLNQGGTATEGEYFLVSFVAGSGTVELFANGGSEVTGSYTPLGGQSHNHLIGAFTNDAGVPGEYWGGEVAEILRYGVEHDSTTRQDVELYLNGKYGIF